MTRIEVSTHINASKSTVWRVIADLDSFALYHPLLTRSYTIGDLTAGVGAERVCETSNDMEFVETVLEWVPEDYYVVTAEYTRGSAAPISDYRGKLYLEETAGGTQVTMTTTYRPNHAIAQVLDYIIMRRAYTRITRNIVEGLKQYVEENLTAVV